MRGSRRGTGQDKGARDGDRALGAVSAARNVKPAGGASPKASCDENEKKCDERTACIRKGNRSTARLRAVGEPRENRRAQARASNSYASASSRSTYVSLCYNQVSVAQVSESLSPRYQPTSPNTPVRSPLFPLKSFTELHRGETRGPDGGREARSRRRRGC